MNIRRSITHRMGQWFLGVLLVLVLAATSVLAAEWNCRTLTVNGREIVHCVEIQSCRDVQGGWFAQFWAWWDGDCRA